MLRIAPTDTVPGPGSRQPYASPRMDFWWLSELRNAIRHRWKRQGMSDRKRSNPGLEASTYTGLVSRSCAFWVGIT